MHVPLYAVTFVPDREAERPQHSEMEALMLHGSGPHGIIDLRDLFQLVIFLLFIWWTGISTSSVFFSLNFLRYFHFYIL